MVLFVLNFTYSKIKLGIAGNGLKIGSDTARLFDTIQGGGSKRTF